MPDVAGYRPEYEIDIERVGIEYLDYPIVVLDKENKKQSTVAKVRMSVDLPSCWRGTHMSRFIEIINEYRGEITFIQIKQILEEVIRQFQARAAHLTLEFPYFLEKIAPISGLKSLMEYKATFNGEIVEGKFDFKLGVKVPVTTLCPCSKEISENGAHSQRTHIGIEVIGETFVWLEELIELGEKCASSPVYATLKREDEKFVTESAYANPRFVEDVVRAVTKELSSRTDILWFRVRASSNESIHNHSAFAQITRGKQGARLKCHSE
ncbi:GTP cyclohydrolase I FolE2 [bacterium]|nr:GTP cyclohydrolase I FolE2 [bacterium]